MPASTARAGSASASASSDRELVVTRTFDAAPELVFDAFTKPEHVERWWAPPGHTIVKSEMDVRPGGAWHLVLRLPNGSEFPSLITYREIVRPSRLVYVYSWGGEPRAESDVETIVTFEPMGGKTNVTMRLVFPSAAVRENAAKYGATEGAMQALERVGEYLSSTT